MEIERQQSHLPKCLFFKHGQYYYVHRLDGRLVWMPFGRDQAEAVANADKLNAMRSADRKAAFGRIRDANASLRESIYARDGYQCAYCGATDDLVIDHVIPFAKGGSTHRSNLVTACVPCNQTKGDRDVREFICDLKGMAGAMIEAALKSVA